MPNLIWFYFYILEIFKTNVKTGFWVQKMHSIKKNRTVSWGLLSDLLLNVSPSFSRYNKVFCHPPPLLSGLPRGQNRILQGGQKWILPGGQNRILPGGQKRKQEGQKNFSRPSGASLPPLIFFLPPLKCISAPAKINPAHATV